MPKRKSDDDRDNIKRKIRRLEKKLRRDERKRRHRRHRYSSDESDSSYSSSSRASHRAARDEQRQGSEEVEDFGWLFKDNETTLDVDSLFNEPQRNELLTNSDAIPSTSHAEMTVAIPSVVIPVQKSADPPPPPATEIATSSAAPASDSLDSDLLDILGTDPTANKKYGNDIQNDLSVRLQHWATTGLTKELRKEFKEKYLTPENCKLIDPPELNPEIKAAVSDINAKRDKAIEGKQKELSLAITCLGEAITLLLSSKEKNTTLLQLLMDSARIVCDCQHADTLTRRNFLLSSVKKEVREQLQNTKVDKLLFGENLAETLKSAKAISKSGIDLKPPATKIPAKKQMPNTSMSARNLNWRAPGPSRKPTTGPPRTKEQAPPTTRARPNASSRPSQHPPRQSYNRR